MKKLNKLARTVILGCLAIYILFIPFSYVNAQKYNMGYLYGSGNYISMIENTRKCIK